MAKLAAAAGVPVILDAGGVEGPIDPAILPCLTLLSPNETELARLTGLPTDSEAQVRRHSLEEGVFDCIPHTAPGNTNSLGSSEEGMEKVARSGS